MAFGWVGGGRGGGRGDNTSLLSRYLDKVDGEEDGLLRHADVVGDDVRYEGVSGSLRVALLLQQNTRGRHISGTELQRVYADSKLELFISIPPPRNTFLKPQP